MKSKDKIGIIHDAIDQLEQYKRYSEEMRKHGKGFTPSSVFSTSHMIKLLNALANSERVHGK